MNNKEKIEEIEYNLNLIKSNLETIAYEIFYNPDKNNEIEHNAILLITDALQKQINNVTELWKQAN